jgi:hypothetical protein
VEARLMRPRIAQELALLRQFHPDLEHAGTDAGDWFLIPRFPAQAGWRLGTSDVTETRICFFVGSGYPSAQPYAFSVPAEMNFKGAPPNNSAAAAAPPFGGSWLQLSWSPETWFPEADVRKGSNLLAWVRSFTERLKEGA